MNIIQEFLAHDLFEDGLENFDFDMNSNPESPVEEQEDEDEDAQKNGDVGDNGDDHA